MRPVTVGTAGHIDHGKSTLVRALTGIDPDRLVEEQRRGMTLDLGFAHLDLPSGRRIGIVDVPGHEALVHNMLAGAGGMDLVMLVVAADEGAMPQTREHLDILRFLRLTGGVVALTKVDLVNDADWIAAVEEDLRGLVAGTPLDDAPVVRVSAKTGVGLEALIQALDHLAASLPPRQADGPARLPVDRSFTMQGFGTVVTGTLWSGAVRPGDVLALLPHGREVRVRGVEVHGEATDAAVAGSRVAVNLAGIEKDQVQRGDVLATPGAFRPTDRLDVRLRLLPSAPPMRHGSPLHLHLGSGAVVARVALADQDRLKPGEEGLAQLRLDEPVVAVHGDTFVVRRYSPTRTIGGGVVLNAAPTRRRGRSGAFAQDVESTGPVALVVAAVASRGRAGMPEAEAGAAAGLEGPTATPALAAARAAGRIQMLGDRLYAQLVVDDLRSAVLAALQHHHAKMPWRRGMPRDELKSRTAGAGGDRLFDAVLADLILNGRVREERMRDERSLLALADHQARLTDEEHRLRTALLAAIERGGIAPPPVEELRRLGAPAAVDRMLQVLLDDGVVTAVAPDLRVAATAVERARRVVVEMLRSGRDVTVGTVRDQLQTSRRYALALLEYFDGIKVTRRAGDRRVAGPRADDVHG